MRVDTAIAIENSQHVRTRLSNITLRVEHAQKLAAAKAAKALESETHG